MDRDESIRYAKKYLEDILSFFGLNTDIAASSDEEVIELNVPSTHLNGFLIGQRGETLRSLQFLVSTTLRNKQAEINRINIDIDGYKKQRAERLAKTVEDWVLRVKETNEPYQVQPMNAADRRVVHQVIAEHPELETSSECEGRDRHVVIRKKTEKED